MKEYTELQELVMGLEELEQEYRFNCDEISNYYIQKSKAKELEIMNEAISKKIIANAEAIIKLLDTPIDKAIEEMEYPYEVEIKEAISSVGVGELTIDTAPKIKGLDVASITDGTVTYHKTKK